MNYLIDNHVIFNTLEYRLFLLYDGQTNVKLSNTAGRVLEELIIAYRNSEAVTRESLFAKVWETQGLVPSNGNLNQQVSLLRKAFLALGMKATDIVTLPKRGLKLNDSLNIVIYNEDPGLVEVTVSSVDAGIDAGVKTPGAHHFTKELMINFFLALSIIIASATAYVYFNHDDRQALLFFDNIADCNIYTLRPVNERERADLAQHIQRAMVGNIGRCDARDKVLFYRTSVAPPLENGINRRTFLAKCGQDASGKLTDCLNFYFYNWDV